MISLIPTDILPYSWQILLQLMAGSALLRAKQQMASQNTALTGKWTHMEKTITSASNTSLQNGLY